MRHSGLQRPQLPLIARYTASSSGGRNRAGVPTGAAGRRDGGAAEDLFGWAVMQMVERPWGITAFGAASVKAVPDLVRVRFKIVRMEQAPAAAFEAVRAAVRAVRGVLR